MITTSSTSSSVANDDDAMMMMATSPHNSNNNCDETINNNNNKNPSLHNHHQHHIYIQQQQQQQQQQYQQQHHQMDHQPQLQQEHRYNNNNNYLLFNSQQDSNATFVGEEQSADAMDFVAHSPHHHHNHNQQHQQHFSSSNNQYHTSPFSITTATVEQSHMDFASLPADSTSNHHFKQGIIGMMMPPPPQPSIYNLPSQSHTQPTVPNHHFKSSSSAPSYNGQPSFALPPASQLLSVANGLSPFPSPTSASDTHHLTPNTASTTSSHMSHSNGFPFPAVPEAVPITSSKGPAESIAMGNPGASLFANSPYIVQSGSSFSNLNATNGFSAHTSVQSSPYTYNNQISFPHAHGWGGDGGDCATSDNDDDRSDNEFKLPRRPPYGSIGLRIPYAGSLASVSSTPSSTPRTSSMSISELCNVDEPVRSGTSSVDIPINNFRLDPDVQIAAEALGSLASPQGLPPRVPTQTKAAPPTSETRQFIHRVTEIPMIRDSITTFNNVYNTTKEMSPIVKYTTETVESGVKIVSMPVLNTLEPALAPLGRFANSQLDRLERNFPSMISPQPRPLAPEPPKLLPCPNTITSPPGGSTTSSTSSSPRESRSRQTSISVDLLAPPPVPLPNGYPSSNGYRPINPTPPTPAGSSSAGPLEPVQPPHLPSTAPHIDRKPRSMWKSVVSNVSSHIISDETIRGLKWALQVLRDAATNIEVQIAFLQQFLQSLSGKMVNRIMGPTDTTGRSSSAGTSQLTPPLSPQPPVGGEASNPSFFYSSASQSTSRAVTTTTYSRYSQELSNAVAAVTREVVRTLRYVMEMLGRYAAAYLPPPARHAVRAFILRLPGRWAQISSALPAPTSTDAAAAEASNTDNSQFGSASATMASTPASYATAASSNASLPQLINMDAPTAPEAGASSSTSNGDTGATATAAAAAATTAADTPPEAQRVLALAAESTNMLQNVMSIFSQSVALSESVLGRSVPLDPAQVSPNFGAMTGHVDPSQQAGPSGEPPARDLVGTQQPVAEGADKMCEDNGSAHSDDGDESGRQMEVDN